VPILADPDLEAAVQDVEELVLAGVDVRRRPATGGSHVLEQHEAAVGGRAGRLQRHGVRDDPDALTVACGQGVAGTCGGLDGVHGRIMSAHFYQSTFIHCYSY
jgi:hypothetical protein